MSFGKLYCPSFNGQLYPNARKILSAAALNSLHLERPEMEFSVTNKTPEYRAKFPLGKVPGFEGAPPDSSSPPFYLWESDAIAQYVSASGPRRTQLLGGTHEEKAKIMQWIHFTNCHFSPSVAALAAWRFGLAPFDGKKEDSQGEEMARWMGYLEGQLGAGGGKWLAGTDEVSLADFTLAGLMYLGLIAFMDREYRGGYPNAMAWMERVRGVEETREIFAGEWIDVKGPAPDADAEKA
ncbi:glutathione S-transferase [Zalerion maritima]|uniref:Glutathione S-transferase n=1 Tax=Zalerion maritima TaxID=339359 RepID=A0AAD5RQS1_9PEZI|nr:glutathione S-transferase [Zalerion maritima]